MGTGNLSRRNLITAGAAGLGAFALPGAAVASQRQRRRKAKNIIFLVSDGMSCGVLSMLDHYLQLTEGRVSHWRTIMSDREAVHGLQDTRSLNTLVTDSAAASSSWGSGRHVWNGMINTFPDGTELRPLGMILKEEAKMKLGLVTTSTITHATPAGFAVAIDQRDKEEQIAVKYLAAGVDVLLGGGDRFFAPNKRSDKRDLYAEFTAAGYTVANDGFTLSGVAGAKKLLGITSNGHVPYYVDRLHSLKSEAIPTLSDKTRKALEVLSTGGDGFLLQVEAARVDHAAHGNDLAGAIFDQLEFDDVVKLCVDWARKDGETLVIITSDHGNSNPGLNGAGDEYDAATAGLLTLKGMTKSYEAIYSALASADTAAKVQEIAEGDLGVKLKPTEAELVVSAAKKSWALKEIDQYMLNSSAMSLALSNHTHVGWVGRQHTNDFTVVTALGPGSHHWSGLTQNVDYFGWILDQRGIRYKNPEMSEQEARRLMAKPKPTALLHAVESHWI
jgi:alkaline phosphatase